MNCVDWILTSYMHKLDNITSKFTTYAAHMCWEHQIWVQICMVQSYVLMMWYMYHGLASLGSIFSRSSSYCFDVAFALNSRFRQTGCANREAESSGRAPNVSDHV